MPPSLRLAAAAAAAFAAAVAASDVPAPACAAGAPTSFASVPRLDFAGRAAPRDWSKLTGLLTCRPGALCGVDTAALLASQGLPAAGAPLSAPALGAALRSPPAGGPLAYAEGLASFSILNLAAAVLLPLAVALCVCGRYCCCCCARRAPDACAALRCGSAWPTRAAARCSCGCGLVELRARADGVVGSKGFDGGARGELGYPPAARAVAFLTGALWVALVVALGVGAHAWGTLGLTRAWAALGSDSLAGGLGSSVAAVVTAAVPRGTELLVALAGDVLAPLLLAVNASVAAAINLPALRGALACANTTLYAPGALPDMAVAAAFLAALNASLTGVAGGVAGVRAGLARVTLASSAVAGNATALTSALSAVGASFAAVNASVATTTAAVANATAFQGSIVSALSSVTMDLAGLAASYPASTTIAALAGPADVSVRGGASAPTLNDVIGAPGAGGMTAAVASGVAAKTASLGVAFAATPNTATTAASLDAVNGLVAVGQGAGGPVAALNASLAALALALGGVPRAAALSAPLNGIVAAANGVPGILDGLTIALNAIGSAIGGVPPVAPLLAQLDKAQPLVAAGLACVPPVRAIADAVDSSLLALPASAAGVLAWLNVSALNATAQTALAPLSGVRASVLAANATLQTSVNITSYLAQVATANATVASQLAALNVSAIFAALANLDAQTSGVDLAPARASVASVAAALGAAAVPMAYAADLRAYGTARGWLLANLSAATAEYAALSKGYCAGGSAPWTACATSADCAGGGTCAAVGAARCYAGAGGAEQATACPTQSDAACSPPARCLGDTARAAALKALLSGASGGVATLPAAQAAVAAAAAAAGSGSTAGASSALASASAGMAGVNIAGYTAQATALSSSLNTTFDSAAVTAALDAASSAIAGVTVSAYASQVDAARALLGNLTGVGSPLSNALANGFTSVDALSSFLLGGGAAGPLARLSRPALAAAAAAAGPSGALLAAAAAVDDLAAAASAALAPLSAYLPAIPLPNATSAARGVAPYGDRAAGVGAYADDAARGPAHFLLSLAAPGAVVSGAAADAGGGAAASVLADATGARWPGGRVCVTGSCIRATAAALSTAPLSSLRLALPGAPALQLAFSREAAMALPWAAPALVALLGAIGLLAPLACARACRCARDPRWIKCPTSCALGLAVCQLPIILLVTALPFAVALFASDLCASGGSLALTLVTASGDAACSAIPGASGTAGACGVNASATVFANVSVSVSAAFNVPAAAAAVLGGGCPTPGSPGDPFASAFASLAASVRAAPPAAAAAALSSNALGGLTLGPGLAGPITDAAAAAGAAGGAFVDSLGASVLTCGALSGVVNEVRSALCCAFVGPVAWYIAAWYATAWVLLVLTLPAATCGRKRLPAEPWGPSVDAARGETPRVEGCCGACDWRVRVRSRGGSGGMKEGPAGARGGERAAARGGGSAAAARGSRDDDDDDAGASPAAARVARLPPPSSRDAPTSNPRSAGGFPSAPPAAPSLSSVALSKSAASDDFDDILFAPGRPSTGALPPGARSYDGTAALGQGGRGGASGRFFAAPPPTPTRGASARSPDAGRSRAGGAPRPRLPPDAEAALRPASRARALEVTVDDGYGGSAASAAAFAPIGAAPALDGGAGGGGGVAVSRRFDSASPRGGRSRRVSGSTPRGGGGARSDFRPERV